MNKKAPKGIKKIAKEFKDFITRGNVVDLAVGMIIGAAFTAIVTALVNNIFKPLIDWIPMGEVSGLITMLVPRNSDGIQCAIEQADLSQSVYINWGAFIMAIINFLLTAVVLFCLVKTINTIRNGMGGLKKDAKFLASLTDEEKASVGGVLSRKNLKKIKEARDEAAKAEAEAKAKEEAAAKAEAEAKAAAEKTQITDLLKDIKELLKQQNQKQ